MRINWGRRIRRCVKDDVRRDILKAGARAEDEFGVLEEYEYENMWLPFFPPVSQKLREEEDMGEKEKKRLIEISTLEQIKKMRKWLDDLEERLNKHREKNEKADDDDDPPIAA